MSSKSETEVLVNIVGAFVTMVLGVIAGLFVVLPIILLWQGFFYTAKRFTEGKEYVDDIKNELISMSWNSLFAATLLPFSKSDTWRPRLFIAVHCVWWTGVMYFFTFLYWMFFGEMGHAPGLLAYSEAIDQGRHNMFANSYGIGVFIVFYFTLMLYAAPTSLIVIIVLYSMAHSRLTSGADKKERDARWAKLSEEADREKARIAALPQEEQDEILEKFREEEEIRREWRCMSAEDRAAHPEKMPQWLKDGGDVHQVLLQEHMWN